MPTKIVRVFKHPGLPRIDVVQKLRTSVDRHVKRIDEGKFKTYDSFIYTLDHNRKNLISRTAPDQGILGFAAYFDKGSFALAAEDIKKQMYDKADKELKKAIIAGRNQARDEIKNRQRKFKSAFDPNKEASGDIYHTLANSLNFALLDEDNRGQNRFLRYVAGSYDKRDGSQVNQFSGITGAFQNEPGGVYGSRQRGKEGKSLTEIYRRGRRASNISRRTVISENAKRLKGRFR